MAILNLMFIDMVVYILPLFTFTHLTEVSVGSARSNFLDTGYQMYPDCPSIPVVVSPSSCSDKRSFRLSNKSSVTPIIGMLTVWVAESGWLPILNLGKPVTVLRQWTINGKCALRTNLFPERGIHEILGTGHTKPGL